MVRREGLEGLEVKIVMILVINKVWVLEIVEERTKKCSYNMFLISNTKINKEEIVLNANKKGNKELIHSITKTNLKN